MINWMVLFGVLEFAIGAGFWVYCRRKGVTMQVGAVQLQESVKSILTWVCSRE